MKLKYHPNDPISGHSLKSAFGKIDKFNPWTWNAPLISETLPIISHQQFQLEAQILRFKKPAKRPKHHQHVYKLLLSTFKFLIPPRAKSTQSKCVTITTSRLKCTFRDSNIIVIEFTISLCKGHGGHNKRSN